jgi:DNA-damage-inducible protein D
MQSRLRDGSLLKKQLVEKEGVTQLSPNMGQLKMPATDGKMRETDVINMKTVLRVVQSIPSKNAEPFKQWLSPKEATR